MITSLEIVVNTTAIPRLFDYNEVTTKGNGNMANTIAQDELAKFRKARHDTKDTIEETGVTTEHTKLCTIYANIIREQNEVLGILGVSVKVRNRLEDTRVALTDVSNGFGPDAMGRLVRLLTDGYEDEFTDLLIDHLYDFVRNSPMYKEWRSSKLIQPTENSLTNI